MVERGSFVRFPDTFTIYVSSGVPTFPPVEGTIVAASGSGNLQVPTSGGTGNENEAMIYDYVLFHQVEIPITVKAEDLITVIKNGKTINGTIKKTFPGQLTNRIWFDEVSG